MNIEFLYELEYCCGDEMAVKMINIEAELETKCEEFDAHNGMGDLQTYNKGAFSYKCTSFIATDEDGAELKNISTNASKSIKETAEEKALESGLE